MANERLYIKVILPNQGEEKRRSRRSGENPSRSKMSPPRLGRSLLLQLGKIEATLKSIPVPARVVPAKVTLEEKAIAKSHRPDVLFTTATCPIIGAGKPGELFVKATPRGVSALQSKIGRGFTPQVEKAISTLRDISPLSASDRLSGTKPVGSIQCRPSKGGAPPA